MLSDPHQPLDPRWSAPTPRFADGAPHRTSPRTVALSVVGVVGSLALILFLVALPTPSSSTSATSGSSSESPVVLVLGVAFLLLRSLAEPLVWWSRTYRVGEGSLRIDSGVLARHRQEVPYGRIQQVDVQQPLLAQLLGVALVRIDTAGEAGHTSVALRFLDRADAEALRAHLLRRRDETMAQAVRPGAPLPPPAPAPTELPLVRVPPGRLAVSALTEEVLLGGLLVLVVVVVWAMVVAVTGGSTSTVAGIAGVAATVGVLTLAVGGITAVATVIRLWDFTLGVRGDDLHLRHGLFDVRELTVPRRRIQHVTILDNPVRRALGFTTLRLRSAASPGVTAGQAGSTTLSIPYVGRAELGPLLEVLSGGRGWVIPPLEPRPPRARGRAIRRRCLVLGLLVVVPAVLTAPGGLLLLAVAGLGVPWGLVAHRRAGLGRTPQVVVFGRGAVRHRIDVLPIDRIQSCRVTSSPFQRRAALATIHVDVAAGAAGSSLVPTAGVSGPELYDTDAGVAAALLAELPRASAPLR